MLEIEKKISTTAIQVASKRIALRSLIVLLEGSVLKSSFLVFKKVMPMNADQGAEPIAMTSK